MTDERFYLREHAGELRVVDRDYCHRDVKVWSRRNLSGMSLAERRVKAAELCVLLNRSVVAS